MKEVVRLMEKIELKVTIEPERLDALRYFLSAKEKSTPEKELQRALEELYEKYIPGEMREYLDSKCKPATSRPRPRRSARAKQGSFEQLAGNSVVSEQEVSQ